MWYPDLLFSLVSVYGFCINILSTVLFSPFSLMTYFSQRIASEFPGNNGKCCFSFSFRISFIILVYLLKSHFYIFWCYVVTLSMLLKCWCSISSASTTSLWSCKFLIELAIEDSFVSANIKFYITVLLIWFQVQQAFSDAERWSTTALFTEGMLFMSL